MADVKTYDPAKVLVVYAGVTIAGFAQGSFVTLTQAEATFSDGHGVDGEPARWANRNPFSTLTLDLMQSSPSNLLLSGLRNTDEASHAIVAPLLIMDANARPPGNTFVSGRAWMTGPPSIVFAGDAQARRWSLRMLGTVYITSGYDGDAATSA